MLNYIQNLSINFLEIIMLCILISKLLDHHQFPSIKHLIYVLTTIVFISIGSTLYTQSPLIHIFLNALQILIIYLLYRQSIFQSLYLFCICYFIIIPIQLLIATAFQFIQLDSNGFLHPFLGTILTIICECILFQFVPLHKLYITFTHQTIAQHTLFFKIIAIYSYLALSTILLSIKNNFSTFYSLGIFIGSTALTLLIITYELLFAEKKLSQKQHELQAYTDYMPIIDELIVQIRTKQHTYNNQIQTITALPLTHTDYESLKSAILNYCKSLPYPELNSSLLNCNLKLLAGFMISKCAQAKSMQKHIHITLESIHIDTVVPEYILIDIIGILIDNAVEATPLNSSIDFILQSNNGKCTMKTKNIGPPITPEFLQNIFQEGYSTKSTIHNERGFGLASLKKIVDSYHGKIALHNEDFDHTNYLCFEVTV